MSEYQYYEFLAIDKPLTSEEMETLRALSTRAPRESRNLEGQMKQGQIQR